MALLTDRPLRPGPARDLGDRVNKRGGLEPRDPRAPKRATAIALLLASATLITLDASAGALEPVRRLAGEVYGPVESVAGAVARPVRAVPDWFRTHDALRDQLAAAEQENAELRSQLAAAPYDRNKLAEYEGLTATAERIGFAVVPARVVALGAAQSFSRTATIDAGSAAGIAPDMTVVNADGLVGRVLRVTRTTATVLLLADADSVVGGRVGESQEVGMVRGTGGISEDDRLDLELVDRSEVPQRDAVVLTWGSDRGAPYVSGIPIGQVTSVYSSLRDSTQRAEIRPFADFAALNVVGVVVPSGTASDRAVIEPDGKLR
jgi:rod shape-determining protein MreC